MYGFHPNSSLSALFLLVNDNAIALRDRMNKYIGIMRDKLENVKVLGEQANDFLIGQPIRHVHPVGQQR